jgi:hypothetical protein
MSRKDFLIILFFGYLFYLLWEGRETKTIETQGDNAAVAFESAYQDGTPADLLPDPQQFTSETKLKKDLDFRQMRMEHEMREEMERFKASYDYSGKDLKQFQALERSHQKSKQEVRDRHREIYLNFKQEYADRNRGLR